MTETPFEQSPVVKIAQAFLDSYIDVPMSRMSTKALRRPRIFLGIPAFSTGIVLFLHFVLHLSY